MSREWYNPRPYGRPRPPWQPPPMGDAPSRGYWGQGPMFRGYPPRPQWDSNSFGTPPTNYQGQYRPHYYQAKRPRYDQFYSYPKRPRYQNNSGNSYGDPFYDKFMLEDPWKELLHNKNPVDTTNGSRCDTEPGISSETALALSENPSPLQVSVANPPSPEGCQSMDESTAGGLLADKEVEPKECTLSSACDGSPVVGKPLDVAECREQIVLEPSNVVSSADEHLTQSGSHCSIVAGSDHLSSASDGGAIGEDNVFPTIEGSHSAVYSGGSSSIDNT